MMRRSEMNLGFVANTAGVTYGAAVQAFLNWAKDNPAKWGSVPEIGVITAIQETFPCN
jgi:hypothetical protein